MIAEALRDGFISVIAPWYYPVPEVDAPGAWFLRAFWALNTCRTIHGIGLLKKPQIGPIPWTAVDQYARSTGLSPHAADVFVRVMKALDEWYMPYHSDALQRLAPVEQNANDSWPTDQRSTESKLSSTQPAPTRGRTRSSRDSGSSTPP